MSLSSLNLVLLLKNEISLNNYTKSDFKYHNIKQNLHALWSKVYFNTSKDDEEQETKEIIKNIQECLDILENRAFQSETKKYRQYYY